MSDFTTIMAKDTITRAEILSQFRLIYDGEFHKRTGLGPVDWTGKMGMLAAATPDIYHILENARSMGERFLYYNISQPTDQEIVQKQEEVKMSSKMITELMRPIYRDYFNSVRDYTVKKGVPDLNMTEKQIQQIHQAAIFCVNGKANIVTDFKTGRPITLPNKPGVGRDRKMFNTLLHALQLMHAHETNDFNAPVQDEHIKIIERCAYSSINRERRKCLEILASVDTPLTGSAIGSTDDFGLNKEAVEKHILPLFAVGLVRRQTDNKTAFKWYLDEKDKHLKKFIRGLTDVKPKEIGEDEELDQEKAADDEFNRW